jgi:hypothetical protein
MPKTYEPIATQTLTASAASVTFSSISSTYTDLVLIMSGSVATNANLNIQFNSDTATNYSATRLYGNGSTAASDRYTSSSSIPIDATGYWQTGFGSNNIISIMNYANTTTNKTVIVRSNNASNGTDAIVGLWRSTAAINAIKVQAGGVNFNSGSTFTLYGIKAA